ncbi:3'-5' exonuclease-like [Nymphaea colorata]|nr:3'-5' exonuclease-like [Nymphaea colorata]
MGKRSAIPNPPEVESLDQKELDAIEAAFGVQESCSSRKRKTVSGNEGGTDRRRLPDWSAISSLRSRRIVPDSGLSSPGGPSVGGEQGRRTTRSMAADSSPRNETWQMVPSSCRAPTKMKYPSMSFSGRIVYSRTVIDAENAAKELSDIISAKRQGAPEISMGLDIEWRPTFRRGATQRRAAVLQICVDTAQCFVMHVIHSGIPAILQSLLEDETIPKVGVAIANDASKILNDYGVRVKGLEDLSGLANRKFGGAPRKWSLGSLVEVLICKELDKPKKIRLGNWEADVLSKDQLHYAATDAYASWYLHQVLHCFPDASEASNTD